ncbi:MAG TPA: copper resistance system multicopper oxidase [Gammaproteobacteria bacterium]
MPAKTDSFSSLVERAVDMRRRRFLEGLAAGGVLAGTGLVLPLSALTRSALAAPLAGSSIELTVDRHPVNFTGQPGTAVLVNGSLPAPLLRWREGDTVSIRVHNRLPEPTSIHWHGIVLPANMDGVPGLSFRGIAPGESYVYRFQVRQSGTYWYHSHSGFQEQVGLYGPIVIDPLEPEPFRYDREHVVMLSDWTDRDPLDLYKLLKKQSHYFNFNRPTLGDFVADAREGGFGAALRERLAWGRMRMSPADLADVGGYGYTFLVNGRPPAGNWTGTFRPGERVRLRFINGSAMTYFDVRIPGLPMTVVAADGQNVHPVTVDEFRIGVAETLDVIVEPRGADAFTIFAQSMDRAGYARGTLAVREGLDAPVPALDEVVYLTMADMGHAGHAAHSTDAGADGGHAGHAGTSGAPTATPSAHTGHSGTAGAHGDHEETAAAQSGAPGAHEGHAASANAVPPLDASTAAAASVQRHPASESGNPGVDMQTTSPAPRLDDPGVGLRGNGRRVLTYADLRTLQADPDGRDPGRTIELHLTGHMGRYMWSFDGVPFSRAEEVPLRYGERLRIVLVNDTMMEHPIHLHGMWSDLEDEEGAFHLRKHTVSMPPGTRRSYRVTADALGRWAYHCHLLYHMEAGMFRVVRVDV